MASNQLNYPKREKLNWEYYNPPENSTPANYCLDSSLHGLQYIGQENRHCFERLFWLAAFITSTVCAGLLIHKLWETHWDTPIVTQFTPIDSELWQIAFPSVTFCNVNKMKMSRRRVYFRNVDNARATNNDSALLKALAVLTDLKNICELETFAKRMVENNSVNWTNRFDSVSEDLEKRKADYEGFINPAKRLVDGSHKCEEMFVFCMWQDEIHNCSKLFRPIVTDYGYCCTFNMIPPSLLVRKINDNEDDPGEVKEWEKADVTSDNLILPPDPSLPRHKFPYRQQYASRSSGLSVMLEPNITEYSCTSTDSEGFLVGLRSPLDFPRMKDDGMLVKHGLENVIKLHPKITVSDESIKKYPWSTRDCLFDDEGEEQLVHYSKYTATNCLSECISTKTLEICKCGRYYMPTISSQQLCPPEKYECTAEVERNATEGEGYCPRCYRTCVDIEYQTEVSFLRIRKRHAEKITAAYPDRNKTDNLTIVHLYFGQPAYQTRFKKETYSTIDLVSSTGGLLGLCLGFSILSVLEICYFFTIRLCFDYRRKYVEKAGIKDELGITPYYREMGQTRLSRQWSQESSNISYSKDPIFKLVHSRSNWPRDT